jgi:hypothetical protein
VSAHFGFNDFGPSGAIKRLRGAIGWTLLSLSKTAGVAQLVEHHLAKVDVASSSLVTRSPFACVSVAQNSQNDLG